jgi:hypothetical protein
VLKTLKPLHRGVFVPWRQKEYATGGAHRHQETVQHPVGQEVLSPVHVAPERDIAGLNEKTFAERLALENTVALRASMSPAAYALQHPG